MRTYAVELNRLTLRVNLPRDEAEAFAEELERRHPAEQVRIRVWHDDQYDNRCPGSFGPSKCEHTAGAEKARHECPVCGREFQSLGMIPPH